MSPQRIIVILGPTAGGKSELAVGVAREIGGEIINADSMQVYRHLNAGTAKPTAEQRAAVPHHLVDCVEPTESWTVADWLDRTEVLIGQMHERGVWPIIVGGTNLYLKALLVGMFDGPPADRAFRATLADVPAPQLHVRLMQVDPVAAERIDPNDHKRIVRALEVFEQSGQPISEQQLQWDGSDRATDGPEPAIAETQGQASATPYRHDPILIGLHWEVDAINRRINARVKAMFRPPGGAEDLVTETRRLAAAGRLGPQAREALGTKQVLAHLSGNCACDEALERTKIDTRRFAKSQRTWLKRYRGVHWLDGANTGSEELVCRAIEIVRTAPPTR